jgi:hypothetical protein
MPDESEVTPDDSASAAGMDAEARLTVGAGGVTMPALRLAGRGRLTMDDVRCAVQELRFSSLEELKRLLEEYAKAHRVGDTADTDTLASKVEIKTNMVHVARLLRSAAKWGIATIIAAIISVPVEQGVEDLMGWTPPSITIVRQMSPTQIDELSHQILRQLEQARQRQERR